MPERSAYLQRAGEIIDSLKADFGKIKTTRIKILRLSFATFESFNNSNVGNAYECIGKLDSALYFQKLAKINNKNLFLGPLTSLILNRTGSVYARMGNYEEALKNFYAALENANKVGDNLNPSKIKRRISETYMSLGQFDSSLLYARIALAGCSKIFPEIE